MSKICRASVILLVALACVAAWAGEVKLGVVLDARRPGCEVPETSVKLTNASGVWYRVDVEAFSRSELDRVSVLEMELGKLRAELDAEKARADTAEARLAELSEGNE